MLYGCRHFSTLFLTVSQIPQHTVSADQWEARLYHLLFWEKAVRTKRHTQFRGCSRNTEVHATRQCYGEIWKQGGQRIPRWDCTRVAMVFWHGDTASRPKSVSLLPWVDTPICLEAPRTGILTQRWAASHRHTWEGCFCEGKINERCAYVETAGSKSGWLDKSCVEPTVYQTVV